MAEPSNSDTVTEQDESQDTSGQESSRQRDAATSTKQVPRKASPLQKSFLERRKARNSADSDSAGAGPKDSAADRVDLQKSASRSTRPRRGPSSSRTRVRRTAADREKVTRIGLRIVAGVALLAVVAAAVFFGVGKYHYDKRDELRAEYASFAQQVTVNLTTLTPASVGNLEKTLLEQTSGYAKQQMEQAVKQTVELVKQGQLSTQTRVLSTAVTRADDDRGSAIMVFGWTSTPKNPNEETVVETYRWRVDMTRINGELKLTNFEWVW